MIRPTERVKYHFKNDRYLKTTASRLQTTGPLRPC